MDGLHETVDAWVLQADSRLTVVLTNHALPRQALCTEQVRIALAEVSVPHDVSVKRIDAEHANPKRLWQEFGAPEYLSAAEVEQLKRASEFVKEPQPWTRTQDTVTLETTLPPYGVASITLEFAPRHERTGTRRARLGSGLRLRR